MLLQYLPAQACILQVFDWWDGPLQVLPPLEGAGLLQALLRYCLPLPQLLLQGPNDPQGDQCPLTTSKGRKKRHDGNKLTAHIDALINKDENLIFQTEESPYLKKKMKKIKSDINNIVSLYCEYNYKNLVSISKALLIETSCGKTYCGECKIYTANIIDTDIKGAFHLSELTSQVISVVMKIYF